MRKTKDITITEGRDAGKVFRITEKSAAQTEAWALQAFLALGRSGVEIPEGAADQGVEGLLSIGIKALFSIRYEDLQPLLDSMMECAVIVPDKKDGAYIRKIEEEDIEDVGTLLTIRKEVIALHTGFFTEGSSSISAFMGASKGKGTRTSRAS
jgi:hypothetical protein